MKLLRLKLLSQFRGLQKDFEIEFDKNINTKCLEPICFVGQNGCGKSNVMEALSEIFYELELMHLNYSDDDNDEDTSKSKQEAYGYEIEYLLPATEINESNNVVFIDDENSLVYERFIRVLIEKKNGESPTFFVYGESRNLLPVKDRIERKKLLPTKIIGYSSGMNELISSPFIKMRLHYFNEYIRNIQNEYKTDIEGSRMFYMDYETNALILISNYLIHNSNKIKVINEILNVNRLHSFRIVINLEGTDIDKSYKINDKDTVGSIIDKLKKCTTCYDDSINVDESKLNANLDNATRVGCITFDFWVNEATNQAFKQHFNSASELYSDFYTLNSLNLEKIPSYQRKKILNHRSASTLTGLIPKTTDDNLIFRIEDILLCKNGVNDPIHYKKFSDGEHQLMQTIGAVLLMDEPGTLFLMDEPETHFNPQWRSKFVSTLNKITENEAEGRQQELILTTHSPFILSDCQTQNVYKFVRSNGIVKSENPSIQTYGTSFSILYKEIFDKENTVSDLVADSIERLKNESIETNEDIERIKDEVLEFGESAEKFFLLSYLNRRKKQIDSKDDGK